MRVFVLTLGTRGDVQPYIALGQELRSRGHHVTICTSSSFKSFVLDHGLEYGYMNDGFMAFLDSADGRDAVDNSRNLWELFKTFAKLIKKIGPMQREIFADGWAAAAATAPDLIVAHPKTVWAIDLADKLGIPVVMTAFQAVFVPTRHFPALAFPRLPFGAAYNKGTYRLIQAATRALEGKHVKQWRQDVGLDSRRRGRKLLETQGGAAVPVLHAFSELVVPRPDDWPDSALSSGFWYLEEPGDWQPPEQLERFLAAGEPPVYIGFGSMAGRKPERIAAVVSEAVQRANVRAVVGTGRGGIAAVEPSDNIMQIDSVPHAWLFPRVSAVVHHGGAGTTAAGLRAGRPTVICPFFGDQPFWGERVFALGVGSAPIPQKKLTAGRLADALRLVTTDSGIRDRASRLGQALQCEHGAAKTADFLEALVAKNGG